MASSFKFRNGQLWFLSFLVWLCKRLHESFSSIFDPDMLDVQIYAFEKINVNPTHTNVNDKSRNVIFYQLLWLSRGNGEKKYHYLHEQIGPFPCRSILMWLDRKGPHLVYILVLNIGIIYYHVNQSIILIEMKL